MPATPELAKILAAILRNAPPGRELTLGDARRALLEGILWSDEGELLYAQDVTSLVLELDDLIERYGAEARARHAVDQTLA